MIPVLMRKLRLSSFKKFIKNSVKNILLLTDVSFNMRVIQYSLHQGFAFTWSKFMDYSHIKESCGVGV